MSAARPAVAVLLGPTAVGKTEVALALCERLGGEVIGADSRQVYRGLELGSAAPTAADRRRVPHHLVGFLEPTAQLTAAEFRDLAEAAIAQILAGGRTPVVVAGTGFYLSTLVYGWSLTGVAGDEAVRQRLEPLGTEALYARLREVDPASAGRLAPADRKRVIRALEVYELTGTPLSEHHRLAGTRRVPYDYHLYGLERPRAELYQRIDRRVEDMVARGWLAEVELLQRSGLTGDERALEGLGYRRLLAALRGETTLAEAVTLTKQDTRRFAKRQMTWFRTMAEVTWIDVSGRKAAEVAEEIAARWRADAAGSGA